MTSVTLSTTDQEGNSASCTVEVMVVDDELPTISCPSNQSIDVGVSCEHTLADYTGFALANDVCTSVSITQNPMAGKPINGTTEVILTANDANNNMASCTFRVTLSDSNIPNIVCPNPRTITIADGSCSVALPNLISRNSGNR